MNEMMSSVIHRLVKMIPFASASVTKAPPNPSLIYPQTWIHTLTQRQTHTLSKHTDSQTDTLQTDTYRQPDKHTHTHKQTHTHTYRHSPTLEISK